MKKKTIEIAQDEILTKMDGVLQLIRQIHKENCRFPLEHKHSISERYEKASY